MVKYLLLPYMFLSYVLKRATCTCNMGTRYIPDYY